jgi:hypothetical protein
MCALIFSSSFRGAPFGAGPESILPVLLFRTKHYHRGYGFRARARARPGMTEENYFPGGFGHGFCAPRRPSNVFAIASTP